MPLYVTAGKIKKLWRTDDDAVLHEVKNLWTDAGQVFSSGPTIEVYEVSLSGIYGRDTFHSLITLSPPPGEVWQVEVEGRVSGDMAFGSPYFRVGSGRSGGLSAGAVAYSGEVTSADSRVGVVTYGRFSGDAVAFVGTVTVTKP